MFLKSIEIFGFKSFAEKNVIEFQDGISALLGPNGCGKSNIVDSVKWVLGEQATKSLRAEKMEDVIFNGTETRKALNVAEVNLILSNDSGILPLDIPEISVKRRLYRSGESEYYINNTPVKLKELRAIFFDTGIGKSSYSIMEQGRIDQILSNRPEERRHIFEEAAGITKYKIKRAEAERKLAKTDENMKQAANILSEVRRSYNILKAQSEKTTTYRELREDIFVIEVDIQLLRLKKFSVDKESKNNFLDERLKTRDRIKSEIDQINESLEENLDIVNNMESKLIENQKKLYGLDVEKNSKESQIIMLLERKSDQERQISANRIKETNIKEKIQILHDQIKSKEKTLVDFKQRLNEVNLNISGFENNIKNAEQRIIKNEDHIALKEKENHQLENTQIERQKELRSITDDIVTQLDTHLKANGYSYKDRKNLEDELFTMIETLKISFNGKIKIVDDFIKIEEWDKKEVDNFLGANLNFLNDGLDKLSMITNLFKEYRKTTPSFIDDFLAPEGIITIKRKMDKDIENILINIKNNREAITSLRFENKNLQDKIGEYRKTLEDLRVNKAKINAQKIGIEENIKLNIRNVEEQKSILDDNENEIKESMQKIDVFNKRIEKAKSEKNELEKIEKDLQKNLSKLEGGILKKNKDLVGSEKKLKDRMASLGKVQSDVEKLQIDMASMSTEIKNIHDNFKEKHSRELREFESKTTLIDKSIKDLKKEITLKRDDLKRLGQVNLMAPEEFAEVKERFDFLNDQLNDLERAKNDLIQITKEIKTESTEMFLETYDKIKKNFHVMFRRLFGGGRAELKLSDTENVLTSGIEIYAQPPGKKLENISLLSGGERSITAVALLFATYMVKPSPFCILDEIDAALDEANIIRFANLLSEFSKMTQFIIITHNKKTVTSAGTLIGVTMEESGVSKIISMRLKTEKDV